MTLTLWLGRWFFFFFLNLPRASPFPGLNKIYCYWCFDSISSRTDLCILKCVLKLVKARIEFLNQCSFICALQYKYSAAYKVEFLWQFTINMQHEDKKFIQHKIQYTVAQCGVGVGVSRQRRGGGNLVFVLLCFNYSTICYFCW